LSYADPKQQSSMSCKEDCWDNAPMESFWGRLKNKLVFQRSYQTRQEAIQDTGEYIDIFYNC
jgi:putative transposase